MNGNSPSNQACGPSVWLCLSLREKQQLLHPRPSLTPQTIWSRLTVPSCIIMLQVIAVHMCKMADKPDHFLVRWQRQQRHERGLPVCVEAQSKVRQRGDDVDGALCWIVIAGTISLCKFPAL